MKPQVRGTYLRFSVDPPLPEGLVLDGASGVVAGSPVADTVAVPYTVKAKNEVFPYPPMGRRERSFLFHTACFRGLLGPDPAFPGPIL